MKKLNLLLLIGALGPIGCQDTAREKEAIATEAEIAEMENTQETEWITLFNGENLENWKAYNSDSITQWEVEDHAIVFTPAEGER